MATWIGSPNYNTGRVKIDRIVIHWMVGTLSSTDNVFQLVGGVSAHYGIEGTKVHQYVQESHTAFHAGDGNMNLRSIGIEHSAAPGRDATPTTLETSAKLIADICKRYQIPCDRAHILKHSEVSGTQCPGTIPIDSLVKRANEILKGDDMADETDINEIFRLYLQKAPSSTQLDWAGKKTRAEVRKIAKTSATFKALIQDAKEGTLKPERHMPVELRNAYKAPVAQPTNVTVLNPGTYEVK